MILVCLMENQVTSRELTTIQRLKAYFQSKTYINLENTVVKFILGDIIEDILEGVSSYQMNSSGWYFKEVIRLEIHIIDYKPMKGGSYISLPEFIKKKMQSLILKIKMINVFFGLFFVIFIPFKIMEKE